MAKKKLTKVLEPEFIGTKRIKNRLVRMGANPWAGNKDTPDYSVSPKLVDYYEELAAGGAGIVTIAGAMVELETPKEFQNYRVDTDEYIPSLKKVSDAIHKHDAVALFQVMSPYPDLKPQREGALSLASSTLSEADLEELLPFYAPPREMTKAEILKLTDRYVEQAVRFKKAGFDGIELNSGHVHFHNTFLSPAWNRRTDEYGGDANGRSKMLCDMVRAIKAELGKDFIIVNLMSGAEYNLKNGITVADAIQTAKNLEAAGSDAIHIRIEVYHDAREGVSVRTAHEVPDIELYPALIDKDLTQWGIDTSFGKGVAAWSLAASEVKKNVDIPVIVSGRMDAYVAEKLIRAEKIDFANICRRNIADPEYAKKLTEGRDEDVRPCTGCFTCYECSERGIVSWCMVNPSILQGADYAKINPAEVKKRVLIIGSGAAGLESARVAALRGHDVTIVEREPQLGGSLPLAGFIKDFEEDFVGFSKWQVRQIDQLGIKVRLNTTANAKLVQEAKPDVIIVAVGGAENIPNIPGIDNKIVLTGQNLHNQLKDFTKVFSAQSLGKLSKLYLPLGKRVVIVGGEAHGVQTARFLVARGRQVTIVEESDEIGSGMYDCGPKPLMLGWLLDQGTEFITEAKYQEITSRGLIIIDKDGNQRLIEADNVVTTLPMSPNLDLYQSLKDLAPEVYAIGDCNPVVHTEPFPPLMLQPTSGKDVWPGFTASAVREAYRILREV